MDRINIKFIKYKNFNFSVRIWEIFEKYINQIELFLRKILGKY